ncbi:MAG: efflux RND transporter periplasmic adaptor subunit [Alphaproteobacteria bacterium]|uniref:Efflux RND transporter periplasmic adaptor subunit n=1 Tax=Candidatus Nitrobium versatile TaxID=2884831 RepID=A0A953J6C4_9BACT|nr:efflux RND transporter periplasmic adaptor subunit [Candidatus Nitrobium versatile]
MTQAASTQAAPPAGHQGHGGGTPPAPSQEQQEEAAAEEEPQTVEIPTDKQQLIGVRTAVTAVQPLHKVVRTVGRIEYDERKIATITTKIEGWIERLYVDYTGRYVKKGEPLAEIYSPELVATQQEYLNVLKWAKQSSTAPAGGEVTSTLNKMFSRDAETVREAARQRLRLWDISEGQIRKIEETGRPIRTLAVFSPVSGYVVQKTALQGMRVMPGERLFDVADLSTVWVVSDIYEYELPLIRTGQTANISLSYFPGKVFTAKVDYVYPTLVGETRTAKVRFTIPNPGGQLKPQMFTNVEVKMDLGRKLAVPEDAVINTGTRQIVYVDKGEGYFEPREVTTGVSAEGMVEVTKGLKAGEKVASSANFLIDSEARLKGIVQ